MALVNKHQHHEKMALLYDVLVTNYNRIGYTTAPSAAIMGLVSIRDDQSVPVRSFFDSSMRCS